MNRQHPEDPNLFLCTRCKAYKRLDEFSVVKYKNEAKPHAWCRKCLCRDNHERYVGNKDKIAAQVREYRLKHKDKIAACQKEWQLKNKDKIAARSREYRLKHKDKIDAYKEEWRLKNKDKIAAQGREYRLKHKDKIDAEQQEYRVKSRDCLYDSYIKHLLKNAGFDNQPSQLIELVRQRITMRRSLRALKNWRNEYESDRQDASAK